jgi:hypothetical protein
MEHVGSEEGALDLDLLVEELVRPDLGDGVRVRHAHDEDYPAFLHQLDALLQEGRVPEAIEHDLWPQAVRLFLHERGQVLVLRIHGEAADGLDNLSPVGAGFRDQDLAGPAVQEELRHDAADRPARQDQCHVPRADLGQVDRVQHARHRLGQSREFEGKPVREFVDVPVRVHSILGKSTRMGIAVQALVLAPVSAEVTAVTGQAGLHSNAVADLELGHAVSHRTDHPGEFVADDPGRLEHRELPFEDVHVRGADAAGHDLDLDIEGSRFGDGRSSMSNCSMPFQTAAFMRYAPFGVARGGDLTSPAEEAPDVLESRNTGTAAQAGAFQRRDSVSKTQYIPGLPPLQESVEECAVKHIAGARGVHDAHRKQGLNNSSVPKGRPRAPQRQPDARRTKACQLPKDILGVMPAGEHPPEPLTHDEDV